MPTLLGVPCVWVCAHERACVFKTKFPGGNVSITEKYPMLLELLGLNILI